MLGLKVLENLSVVKVSGAIVVFEVISSNCNRTEIVGLIVLESLTHSLFAVEVVLARFTAVEAEIIRVIFGLFYFNIAVVVIASAQSRPRRKVFSAGREKANKEK